MSEELLLDYHGTNLSMGHRTSRFQDYGNEYTQNCYGNSTLNYYKLPNYWNGHIVGALLNKVPNPTARNPTYQNAYPQELTAGPPTPRILRSYTGPVSSGPSWPGHIQPQHFFLQPQPPVASPQARTRHRNYALSSASYSPVSSGGWKGWMGWRY